MIAAGSDQIRAIGTKGAVPDPPLVPMQRRLQGKLFFVNTPDFGGVVGGAGGEVAYVGREEDARYVFCVGLELADGDELGNVAVLDHAPDVAVSLEEGGSG